jgi:hypothetical protein
VQAAGHVVELRESCQHTLLDAFAARLHDAAVLVDVVRHRHELEIATHVSGCGDATGDLVEPFDRSIRRAIGFGFVGELEEQLEHAASRPEVAHTSGLIQDRDRAPASDLVEQVPDEVPRLRAHELAIDRADRDVAVSPTGDGPDRLGDRLSPRIAERVGPDHAGDVGVGARPQHDRRKHVTLGGVVDEFHPRTGPHFPTSRSR